MQRPRTDGARGVRVSRAAEARPAQTRFRVLARAPDERFALVEASPRTGRTHQIRVHLRHARVPIVGDAVYGRRELAGRFRDSHGLWRQWLHAARLAMSHPVVAGERLHVAAPLPEDLERVLSAVGIPSPAAWYSAPADDDGGAD